MNHAPLAYSPYSLTLIQIPCLGWRVMRTVAWTGFPGKRSSQKRCRVIASTVFIDTIFAIPGFGSITANALMQLDYPVILGVTLVSSILVIATNTLVDLVYPMLDPRVTLK